MSILRFLTGYILLFLLYCSSLAQTEDSLFLISLQHEDICIENEKSSISFVGQKAEYIEVVFEKDVEYRILTNSETIFPYELPENNDPTFHPHGPEIRNLNRILDDVKIDHFTVKVTKPDETEYSPSIIREIKSNRIVTDRNIFGEIFSYLYMVDNLEKGDLVKISYKYSARYISNFFRMFSYRMFFHDIHPRKNYELTLSHHFDLEVDTFFMNGSYPIKKFEDDHIIYNWKFTNLQGCLDEPGSRPYIDLPWFTLTVKPYELLYQDFNSFRESFVPMWYYLSARRENQFRTAVYDAQIGTKNKDNLAFDKIADKYKQMAPDDSSGIEKLRLFQRYMIDSVVYDNDSSYYKGDENYIKDHPGVQLKGQRVKDHLKDYVYASMISKFDHQYFSAYIADNRSGAMAIEYYTPAYDNEMLFGAVLNNNSIAYLLPKSDTRNFHCEELPFYYESSPVLLVYTYDFAGYKRNFNELVRIINTPGSLHTDNYRKTNSIVNIDLSELMALFKTKVSLSGQYSTLTRYNYDERASDSTINPRYLRKVWEIGQDYEVTNSLLNETSMYFPFQTSITAEYKVKELISLNDGQIVIDLKDWAYHVIHEGFSSQGRYTDFHPDFLGSDTYSYMLMFDREVKLSSNTAEIELDNDFGKFSYNIKQVSPKQILITSYFLTKQPSIERSGTIMVEEIYRAIENSESTILELSIQ